MSSNAADRYLERQGAGRRKEIITPEGVPLGFTLAQAGDRAAGFVIDMVIIFGVLLLIGILFNAALGSSFSEGSWLRAFLLLISFFLQNFYFIYFEIKWQGVTPGKRLLGIRVIDRNGSSLSADAVIARNLMRDVEVFIPLQLLAAPEQLWPNAPGWATLLASMWVFVFLFLPLFNKDRLRVGDMVAGTLVVLAPKALLLADIGGQETARVAREQSAYTFTDKQLDVYGIYELQVLEDLLRKDADTMEHLQALDAVCEQIKRKIGWDKRHWHVESERFLREFYTAMRAHLERKMLFGKRREDKYSRE